MKKKLIGIKISDEDLDIIDQAAYIDRRPRSQFIGKYALDKAKKIIGDTNAAG